VWSKTRAAVALDPMATSVARRRSETVKHGTLRLARKPKQRAECSLHAGRDAHRNGHARERRAIRTNGRNDAGASFGRNARRMRKEDSGRQESRGASSISTLRLDAVATRSSNIDMIMIASPDSNLAALLSAGVSSARRS
jgi:hypothetical protein